jgi:hypothetical protein
MNNRGPPHRWSSTAALTSMTVMWDARLRGGRSEPGREKTVTDGSGRRIRAITSIHAVPHLLAARAHGGAAYCTQGTGPRPEMDGRGRTPLVRVSALHGVSRPHRGDGSHLGSSLNPRGAVLTGGVSRRSGSVACVRADASPSEVLATAMMNSTARESQSQRAPPPKHGQRAKWRRWPINAMSGVRSP